jgi:choline monooxygenase
LSKSSELFDPARFAEARRPPDQARTPPPDYYTSEAWFGREAERIFRRTWVCVGRVERAPAPGDYFTIELAGTPLAIVRGRDGMLRAFVNSCRHRGARLLDGAGNARAIQCPYHSWVYRLDGALQGAPDMDGVAGFQKERFGLVPARCDTAHGFVFVNLDLDAGPLTDFLGDFDRVFAPYDFANMVCVRRTEFETRCNWKASAEVFMEYYHTYMVHPASLGTTERIANPPDDVRGNFATMFSDHKGSRALIEGRGHRPFPPIATLTGRPASGTRFSLIYPGFALGCTIDAMWFIESYPQSAGRTKYAIGGCFPRSTVARPDFEALAPGYHERWETAVREDNEALERQHQGLLSPYARQGRMQPRLEPIVQMLARWVTDRVIGNS